jgi:phytoene synthase
VLLQFDRRLARIVSRTTEPMLGQMRLAWWRDVLKQPREQRPLGDAVLDGIGTFWSGHEEALIAMVDGWEILIGEEQLGPDDVTAFADGRAAPFVSFAGYLGGAERQRVEQAARCWALVEVAVGVSDPEERALFLDAARECSSRRGRIPGDLRGLAVLEALARRALRNDGAPLMAGRGAALTALRAAIFLS